MAILQGLIGFMILIMGSQLYWFFAGVIGFLTGIFAASQIFHAQSGTNIILIGAGAAVIGVLLTITARKPAMVLIGFLAGVIAANTLPELFGWTAAFSEWYLLVFGGLIGGLFVLYAYSYATILLSAIIGAQLIAAVVHLGGVDPQVMFLAVLILGIAVQILLARYAVPSIEEH